MSSANSPSSKTEYQYFSSRHLPTVYPQHPPESRVILQTFEGQLSLSDRLLVAGSSLFVVGAVAWVPYAYYIAWKQYRAIPLEDRKRRRLYASLICTSIAVMIWGPHRSPRVGRLLHVRKWRLWDAWLRYIAMKVVADDGHGSRQLLVPDQQSILAFVPHGIFPFAFAFGALPNISKSAFGVFQPVIATATNLLPIVRTLLHWLSSIDASRNSVDQALSEGCRIGIVPGGIAEIFEGYPKANTKPDEEYAIVRKGFLRMALKHNVPVIPIYCFGSSKFFKRLHLNALERLSLMIRVSLCLFFGKYGLPIPFRQRLLYVIGHPVHPPTRGGNDEEKVDQMHQQFCDELMRLFERHKKAYGWPDKTLKLLSR
ncbi:hypothetical protein MPSEU_000564500 [Mayamaea pseudoterrestris]|nr:hypothetical protein MPSEU_000564500 [Mayamaea pseudoterrestris]